MVHNETNSLHHTGTHTVVYSCCLNQSIAKGKTHRIASLSRDVLGVTDQVQAKE